MNTSRIKSPPSVDIERVGGEVGTHQTGKTQLRFLTKVALLLILVLVNGTAVTITLQGHESIDFASNIATRKKMDHNTSQNQYIETEVVLKAPFTGVIAGPTGSGKTQLVMKLIREKDSLCSPPPVEVHYCAGVWQDSFNETNGVNYHEGLIDVENELPNDGKHRWIIIDDLMEEVRNSKKMLALFTKFSHHRNISVWFLTQNFFHKDQRSITLQAQYIFLGKNPREMSQLLPLGKQLFPNNSKFLVESYQDATQDPYSFLFLDLKQTTPEHMRVLGNFPPKDKEDYVVTYSPK